MSEYPIEVRIPSTPADKNLANAQKKFNDIPPAPRARDTDSGEVPEDPYKKERAKAQENLTAATLAAAEAAKPRIAAPTFLPVGGNYSNDLDIVISDTEPEAFRLYYTTDGTTPEKGSTRTKEYLGVPVEIKGKDAGEIGVTSIKLQAYAESSYPDILPSEITSALYVISNTNSIAGPIIWNPPKATTGVLPYARIGKIFGSKPFITADNYLTKAEIAVTSFKTKLDDILAPIKGLLKWFETGSDWVKQQIEDKINIYIKELTNFFSQGGSYIVIHPYNSKKIYTTSLLDAGAGVIASAENAVDNISKFFPLEGELKYTNPKALATTGILIRTLSPRQAFDELYDAFNEDTPSTPKWGALNTSGGWGFILFAGDAQALKGIIEVLNALATFFDIKELWEATRKLARGINKGYNELNKLSSKGGGDEIKKNINSLPLMMSTGANSFFTEFRNNLFVDININDKKGLLNGGVRHWATFSLDLLPLIKQFHDIVTTTLNDFIKELLKMVKDIQVFIDNFIAKIYYILDMITTVLTLIRTIIKWLLYDIAGGYAFIIPPWKGGKQYIIEALKKGVATSPLALSNNLDVPWSILFFTGFGKDTTIMDDANSIFNLFGKDISPTVFEKIVPSAYINFDFDINMESSDDIAIKFFVATNNLVKYNNMVFYSYSIIKSSSPEGPENVQENIIKAGDTYLPKFCVVREQGIIDPAINETYKKSKTEGTTTTYEYNPTSPKDVIYMITVECFTLGTFSLTDGIHFDNTAISLGIKNIGLRFDSEGMMYPIPIAYGAVNYNGTSSGSTSSGSTSNGSTSSGSTSSGSTSSGSTSSGSTPSRNLGLPASPPSPPTNAPTSSTASGNMTTEEFLGSTGLYATKTTGTIFTLTSPYNAISNIKNNSGGGSPNGKGILTNKAGFGTLGSLITSYRHLVYNSVNDILASRGIYTMSFPFIMVLNFSGTLYILDDKDITSTTIVTDSYFKIQLPAAIAIIEPGCYTFYISTTAGLAGPFHMCIISSIQSVASMCGDDEEGEVL